jgi:pyruvate dehydrogenase E1 component alpha subunit
MEAAVVQGTGSPAHGAGDTARAPLEDGRDPMPAYGVARTVADFSIERIEVLDAQGVVHGDLPDFARDPGELVSLYRAMTLTRTFDEKAVALQRTGRLGTYASSLGQEAVGVGIASAMRRDDVFLPSFREHGAQLGRGVSMLELLLFWGGDERGSDFGQPREDFPVCIPVGSHVPHAAGVALAMKLRGDARAALCVFGDGATSKGDFYEALNLTGVWSLPLVVVVTNNEWAISVSRAEQTRAASLAQKAVAVGIAGVQVDGNDVIAVRAVTASALDRARRGRGPTLIEACTYRLGDHTTADDASRYRDDDSVSGHWREEPVARLRNYLLAGGYWDKAREEALIESCASEVGEAVERYLATAPQDPSAVFDFLFETLPEAIAEQREALERRARGDG